MHKLFAYALLATFAVCTPVAAELEMSPVELPAYSDVSNIELWATPEEYETALSDAEFELRRASYPSDDLTVFAYVYGPVDESRTGLPVIIFNRGSYVWKDFAGEYLTTFHRLAKAGFLVIAPMYRGSGGAEGRDEMGGTDVNDLLNTTELISELHQADSSLVFMYGESRGGMMTLQAAREHYPMKAAAVYGTFTDLAALTSSSEQFAGAAAAIWPDYSDSGEAINQRRSAVAWADRIDVPLLIMHGGADDTVPPSHSLRLAEELQRLGKPYELVIRAGSNHVLSQWRSGRDAYVVEWFRRHMSNAD